MSSPNLARHGHGRGHWWAQRLTALALLPLLAWFVASLVALTGASHGAVIAWFETPVTAAAAIVLLAAMFYHSQLGLQTVLEDYVDDGPLFRAAILLTRLASFALAAVSIAAVLAMALGG